MPINDLIAAGGRQNRSPIQRFLEARSQAETEKRNRLASEAQQQSIDINRRNQQLNEQKQKAALGQDYAKAITPIVEQVNKLPEAERQDAWQQAVPEIERTAQQFGIPFDERAGTWNQQRADGLISQFGKTQKAPTTRTVLEGAERVNQEWDAKKGVWKEVGRGITSQQTGEPGSFDLTKSGKSKIQVERADAQVRLEKKLRGYDFIEGLVKNPDFVGGITGKTIGLVNSAAAQFRQTTGDDPIINNGRIDLNQIDPDSTLFKRLRKAGVINDQLQAATVELAYIMAKDNDKGGRVTDKDYQAAESMLGSSADRASRLSVLDNRRDEDITSYNDQERIFGQRFKGYEPNLFTPKKKESPKEFDLDTATDQEKDLEIQRLMREIGAQ